MVLVSVVLVSLIRPCRKWLFWFPLATKDEFKLEQIQKWVTKMIKKIEIVFLYEKIYGSRRIWLFFQIYL